MPTQTMTAIQVEGGKGPAEALKAGPAPRPEPGPGEVLIRVRAAGVNRADLLQRRGMYPPPDGASPIIGMEASGEIAALGAGVHRWKIGDGVCALMAGGGYAEYAAIDQGSVLPIPEGLDFVQAAALPEAVFTVWTNVFEIGALQPGETLLVHGATSGIGVTAIQMAKALGSRVIATSRGAAKAAVARELGAELALDAAAEDWVEAVKAAGAADVVLDMVGGDYIGKDLAALKPMGRIVVIAFPGGAKAEVDLNLMMRRRLSLTGSTLRGRSKEEKARLAAEVEARIWPLVLCGALKPVVDRAFPLAEAAKAHARLEAGDHVGKVVLTVS